MAHAHHHDHCHGHAHGHDHELHRFKPEIGREVDDTWVMLISNLVDPTGKTVVDVGCGAGVYVRGWLRMGASKAFGIDPNEESIAVAREAIEPGTDATFLEGTSDATGLDDGCADIVYMRAVLHHVEEPAAFFVEAARLLRPGGTLIIQDWTAENNQHPGSNTHPFGYTMALVDSIREHRLELATKTEDVQAWAMAAGFGEVQVSTGWETHRTYASRDEYLEAMASGEERRFLRFLEEDEVQALVVALGEHLEPGPVTDANDWTIWTMVKP